MVQALTYIYIGAIAISLATLIAVFIIERRRPSGDTT
jgi:hypothetical protein